MGMHMSHRLIKLFKFLMYVALARRVIPELEAAPAPTLDISMNNLAKDPALSEFAGCVLDSNEGRWTLKAAIDEAVPAPVLFAALYRRRTSRVEAAFQDKVLSAMRDGFGAHLEQAASTSLQGRTR
jgi:hypothetical protein